MLIWIIYILRILALVSGLFCFYVSSFLYENQEGKIQNTLEEIWIRIDDYKQHLLSKQAIFLREVAQFTQLIFHELFGKELFSWRSVAVSTCYSISSVCLIISYRVYSHDGMVRNLIESTPADVIVGNSTYSEEYGKLIFPILVLSGICFFILACIPAFIKKLWSLKIWFLSVAISVLLFVILFYATEYSGWIKYFQDVKNVKGAGHTSLLWEDTIINISSEIINRSDFIFIMLSSYCLGIFFGFLSDILFIAITRKMLEWASKLDSFVRILCVIMLNCLLALLLCLGPAFLGFGSAYVITGHSTGIFGLDQFGHEPDLTTAPYSLPIFALGLQQAGYISSLSNILTSLFSTVFILIGLIFLIHRIFWPLIERVTYALQRIGIRNRKKLFATFGFILLGLAKGSIPSWLKDIINHFT